MIRIVYTPILSELRHTKFVTELDQSALLDIKEIYSLSVVSDVSGEILHKVELRIPEASNTRLFYYTGLYRT